MNEKTFAAPRARAAAIPAPTLQETTITPTQAIDSSKAALTQGLNTVINSTQDFVAVGKANLDAVGTSGKIWAAGVQEITQQFASTVKASYEESVATFKAMSTAKSIKEALDLQGTYVKSAFSKAVAEFLEADRCVDQAYRAGAGAAEGSDDGCGWKLCQGGLNAPIDRAWLA